jgi:hypothetical protein
MFQHPPQPIECSPMDGLYDPSGLIGKPLDGRDYLPGLEAPQDLFWADVHGQFGVIVHCLLAGQYLLDDVAFRGAHGSFANCIG